MTVFRLFKYQFTLYNYFIYCILSIKPTVISQYMKCSRSQYRAVVSRACDYDSTIYR